MAYGGDPVYGASTSPDITQDVSLHTPVITLSSSVDPSSAGQLVTFRAHVTRAYAIAGTGTVDLVDGTDVIASAPLDSAGTAVIRLATLAIGSHPLVVRYSGDATYTPADSSELTQDVHPVAASVSGSASNATPAPGQSVTYRARVGRVGGVAPTGTVSLMEGATVLGTASVSSQGIALVTSPAGAPGVHHLTMAYSGDGHYGASDSPDVPVEVTASAPTVTIQTSANPAAPGQSITFRAHVSHAYGIASTGTVSLLDGATVVGTATVDASGFAVIRTRTLVPGSHQLTMVYWGDVNYLEASSAPLTEQVGPGPG